MTKTSLRNSVIFVSATFVLVALLAAISRFIIHSEFLYGYLKDFSPLILAVGAAYLAYSFQRRMAFLTSLRDLWKDITQTKNTLINFTYKSDPTLKEYDEAQQKLYNTIDLVRAVYKNVGETDEEIGFYPFEPLHDMRRAFSACEPAISSFEKRKKARAELVSAWHSLKLAFLQEFPRASPIAPVVERGARDPRR
ncbi:hypothetical protein [Methylobacterium sp. WCS2018Hpa-22]|uniref:hypothetical protein n=1 Tax=Methylobacterium sp. WCS2018Hpa-22 TaxID=3073633 RepID=UPI00288A983E|nr:hypothetical protein [Methylobacterium sp. WCS2018Hpa-22]